MRIAHPGEVQSLKVGKEAGARRRSSGMLLSMPLSDQVVFADNLAAMLEVGLSLYEALGIIREETKQGGIAAMINDIQASLQSGQSLSVGMSRYHRVFSPIVVSAIRVGEASGTLIETLRRVAASLQKEIELRDKIMGALWYPIMVLIVMVLVAVVVMDMVMPNLIPLFKNAGIDMPWQTQALIWIYETIVKNGGIVAVSFLMAGVAVYLIGRLHVVRKSVGMMLLYVPVVGTLLSQIALLRFAQNFRTLLGSGLPIIEAFSLLVDTTHSAVLKDVLKRAQEDILRGVPIYRSLDRNAHIFPPMAIRMIAVGERSGMLESILEKLAIFYERKTDKSLQMMTALLSPLLTVLIGAGVAFIAFSVIGPIYKLISYY